MGGPDRYTGQRVGHGTAAVVVEVHADLCLETVEHGRDDSLDLVGEGPPVRVAQDERLGARLLGSLEDAERELRVRLVAVEEVLGVQEHPEVVGAQEGHRVGHHRHRFVEGGAERVDDMHLRRLGHDADRPGLGLHQVTQRPVVLGPDTGTPGRAECHQRGPGQAELLRGAGEELGVLGVGAGPATLDEGHSQVVELLGHPQLVVDGQRQTLLLGPVPQRRVEHVHRAGQGREFEVVPAAGPRQLILAVVTGVVVSHPFVGLLTGGQRVGVLGTVAVTMAVAVAVADRSGLGRRVRLVAEGGAVTRHSPTTPGTARSHRAPRRSRSAGCPG